MKVKIVMLMVVCYILIDCTIVKKCQLISVDLSSISWSIVRPARLPVEAMWPKQSIPQISAIYSTIERESAFFIKLEQAITKISSMKPIKGEIDVRVSCILKWNNCTPDTLSFGRLNKMKYGQKLLEIDRSILKLLLPYLPEEHRSILEKEFFNTGQKAE